MAATLEKLGLAGLYEGRHTGRPKKWTAEQRQALAELARAEGGSVVALLRHVVQEKEQVSISADTAVRYLKQMDFSYKRYRYSLKKAQPDSVQARQQSDRGAAPARS